jgi:hypothetical protein
MTSRAVFRLAFPALLAACHGHDLTSAPVDGGPRPREGGVIAASDGGVSYSPGEELKVPVSSGPVYVKLASPPAIVTPATPANDRSWDLAFSGADVTTNSGPSGSGAGGSFGPIDAIAFLSDVAPGVPFLSPDTTGGAFANWYLYDPESHTLFSRFHVFGVKDGDAIYRVQILDYYRSSDGGAPTSAYYQLRYGLVGQPDKLAADLDGTAGGPQGTEDVPTECIDLGTDQRVKLSVKAARASSAWHLCFRRQGISVNGGAGGPRNVGAVDLAAASTATEQPADVMARTPASELGAFDGVTADSFTGKTFLGDRIISAFTGQWTSSATGVLVPNSEAWLVVGADGASRYLVGFERFEGATQTTLGTVVMRVKSVK